MKIPTYPTNLTEKQWQVIEKMIECKTRKRKRSLREILDAIFYLLKTGCQWRMLPLNFAPWNTVYFYYRKWKNEGVIEEIHNYLHEYLRKKAGKEASPSLGLIDSQSIKTTRRGGLSRGFDGGENVKGRKRHIIVDTMGLLMAVVVHAANEHDSKAAIKVIQTLRGRFSRLVKVVADGGYRGTLLAEVRQKFGWLMEIVLRTDKAPEFRVLPQRWIVERTFSWFESYRRLSKDFEYNTDTSETMVQLAMIKLMLNRIK